MYKLYHNDSLDLQLKNIDLIYLDPPYADKKTDIYFGVGDTFEEYLNFIKLRLEKLSSFMKNDGSNIIIHIDWKAAAYIKVIADGIFGRENFRNSIAWCYSSPSVAKAHLPRKHDDLLWYGIGKYHFNQERIKYQGKLKVGGNTSWDSTKKGKESEYIAKGKLLEDWWLGPPSLCRNEKEKLYPTQKPIALMTRIVNMFSNPGDLVYDPFMGSGSFLAAAMELKRESIGSDISDKAIALATERLSKLIK